MIQCYSWPTPNGHKIHIMLEECALDYEIIPVNIGLGEQFNPTFLNLSPNNKIPAIVDTDGPNHEQISLFESGAILLYLAEKTGLFLPQQTKQRYACLQWLMWQVGGFGPMLGQAHHFRIYAPEKIQYAYDRYTNEAHRLYGVLDKHLQTNQFLAGDDYSIADIATFPWTRSTANQGIDWSQFEHVKRWHDTIAQRPAVIKGVSQMADLRKPLTDQNAKNILFGSTQYERR